LYELGGLAENVTSAAAASSVVVQANSFRSEYSCHFLFQMSPIAIQLRCCKRLWRKKLK
jgi:hypothetical protein